LINIWVCGGELAWERKELNIENKIVREGLKLIDFFRTYTRSNQKLNLFVGVIHELPLLFWYFA
jgi:hypothetical protein